MKTRNAELGTRKAVFVLCALSALSVVFPSLAVAGKQTWTFTLIEPSTTAVASGGVSAYETGCTTPTRQTSLTSGVSLMARRYGPVPDELKKDVYAIDISGTNGVFKARIKELDPSQAVAGVSQLAWGVTGWSASYAGTSTYFYAKVAERNTPGDWASAPMIPIYPSIAISGTSPIGRLFTTPPANYMRVYTLHSGVTAFDNKQIEITSGYPSDAEIPVWVVAEGYFSMPAASASAGVSQFTPASIGAWPGGEYLEYMGGNSVFSTCNGTAPSTTTGTSSDIRLPNIKGSLSGDEARAVQFKTIAAQNIWYRILNRKP